ncbi:hypothetical protein EON79_13250 [bacterium]|nr:MAG: hypothetical protein EON79_13250 [bacterium]
MSIRSLATMLAIAGTLASGYAQTGPDLASSLSWLKKVAPSLPAHIRSDVPAIESILQRYFTDRDSLRASEEEIAMSFLATMPSDLSGRGGNGDRLKAFEALMGGSKAPPKAGKTPPPKPPAGKKPIPGVHVRTVFGSSIRKAPGGKQIGVVTLGTGAAKKTVVEVVSGTTKLDVGRRASVIASRMQSLANGNRLWWATLTARKVNGSYVVAPKNSSTFIITADSAFAREWGLSPEKLARQLVPRIRAAVDPNGVESFAGRAVTEGDIRDSAVELRLQGDTAFATSAQKAEALYLQAIEADGGYVVPYLRLADIYLARKDKAAARSILEKGKEGVDAEGRRELEAKLQKVG